jgi:predicted enzyme related to lactoylglutathione lyase
VSTYVDIWGALAAGDDARAGIMDAAKFLPEGVPAGWQTYWGSSDVDATVATALELGGRVTEAPQDTPFGRVAELIDCTGARLRVISA